MPRETRCVDPVKAVQIGRTRAVSAVMGSEDRSGFRAVDCDGVVPPAHQGQIANVMGTALAAGHEVMYSSR